MTISNYTELKAAVADYLNRPDLTSQIVDFITFAESDINTVSRLLQQETTATITMVSGQAYNNLPSGFLDVIDFYYLNSVDGTNEKLTQVGIEKLNEPRNDTVSAQPYYYAISDVILYDSKPDAAYAPVMRYLKKWDIANDTTNWLLTNHPSAYLYSALAHAEPFIGNDQRFSAWKALAQEKIEMLNDLSSRSRGKARLRVDDGLVVTSGYNVYDDRY